MEPVPTTPRTMTVLYGSQTGTAQDLAEELGRGAKARGFKTRVQAFDEYPMGDLPNEPLVVMVVSTTGDGEEPDNMKKAWRFLLRKSLPPLSASALRYGLFGLGDSTYPKYNAVARRLETRLKQLGADSIMELGLGDDQSPRGVAGDFDQWTKALWQRLRELYLPTSTDPILEPDGPVLEPPLYQCRVTTLQGTTTAPAGSTEDTCFYKKPCGAYGASPWPFMSTVTANTRLTPDTWSQETRHIELDITPPPSEPTTTTSLPLPLPPHAPGDVAYVYPLNPPSAVQMALELIPLGQEAPGDSQRGGGGGGGGVWVEISPWRCSTDENTGTSPTLDLPLMCEATELFRRYLNILGLPRRYFFEQLSFFATKEEERAKLLELASPEGADLYHEYCYREKRTYLEVLKDFPSARPPLDRILQLIPRIQPRAFSIASSSLAHPHRVQLCVAVVQFKTPYKRLRQGLCSTWMSTLPLGAQVPLWIKPGSFLVPPLHIPLVMVGPGTGLAPFRAMVQERTMLRRGEHKQPEADGEVVPPLDMLFFGCRKSTCDYYYREELEGYAAEGKVVLSTAFSREQEEQGVLSKVYVTHRLREAAAEVWGRIQAGGSVLVAGSAKRMPTDVMKAIKDIAQSQGNLSEKEAEKLLVSLVRARRYCVESWS